MPERLKFGTTETVVRLLKGVRHAGAKVSGNYKTEKESVTAVTPRGERLFLAKPIGGGYFQILINSQYIRG
jgi:hypothetical protein